MSYGQVAMESVAYKNDVGPRETKAKKPGFFKRWLFNSLKQVAQADQEDIKYQNVQINKQRSTLVDRSSVELDRDRAISFNIYVANGGRVVETKRYDRNKDRHLTGLYIISDTQDFGREIDKIIVMEGLK